ncbi:MAG: hypothetical protein WC783_04530 [Candidatus Paceibacterota bacterium]
MKSFLLPLITLVVVVLYIYIIKKSRKVQEKSGLPLKNIIFDYIGPSTPLRYDQKGAKTLLYIWLILFIFGFLGLLGMKIWEFGLWGWVVLAVLILSIYLAISSLINFDKIKKMQEEEMDALRKTFKDEKLNNK